MRLATSGLSMPSFRDVTREYLQFYKDIGFQVLGGFLDLDATDDDIAHVKDLFTEMNLEFGECTIGAATMGCPDSEQYRTTYKPKILKGLEIGGKLGATHIQFSVGSMHADNIWMHHPDNHTQKALDILVRNACEIAPYAEDNRCMISPETTQWTIVNNLDRMAEYVDRVDSPYMKICYDFVNHMNALNVYDNGRFARCAVATLGDRIGALHVKDVTVQDKLLVEHIDEADIGTGILDHAAILRASDLLEPWKPLEIEHVWDKNLLKPAYDHIQGVAERIGHTWTNPHCTRAKWEQGEYRG